MQLMRGAILLTAVILTVALSSVACAKELSKGSSSSFGLPFLLGRNDQCPMYPEGLSLADSVRGCHTNVALVSGAGVCKARTLYRFIYEHPGGEEFEATLLEILGKCPGNPTVAVIDVDPEVVHLISPKRNQSPVPRETVLRARRLLDPPETDSAVRHKEVGMDLADTPPEVVKVEHATLLRFGLKDTGGIGPAVIQLDGKLFPLEGWCTSDDLFFLVYNKLYLCYTRHCCGCGEVVFYVYDLSGEAPRIAYTNGKFSD